MEAHTNSGRQAVQQVRLRSIQVGDKTLNGLPAAIISPDRETAGTRVGLLPLGIFHSIYVNHQQHYVIFNPQPRE
jgi:hypothetical protein